MMPGSSPNFAIPYPCVGEPISVSVFSAFAFGVEAALASVDTSENLSLTRPSAGVVSAAGQNVAVGVATTGTYDTELWDTGNLANLAVNNDRLTIQTNGIYMIMGGSNGQPAATTVTSTAVIITVNGVARVENKQDVTSGVVNYPTHATVILPLVAGDVVRTQYLWTGTGGPVTVGLRLSIRMVCLS